MGISRATKEAWFVRLNECLDKYVSMLRPAHVRGARWAGRKMAGGWNLLEKETARGGQLEMESEGAVCCERRSAASKDTALDCRRREDAESEREEPAQAGRLASGRFCAGEVLRASLQTSC
jgi:hypothetical protein